MTAFYRARFSDGAVRVRKGVTKVYAAAWRAVGRYTTKDGVTHDVVEGGFSGSDDQAYRNRDATVAWLKRGYRVEWTVFEVVPLDVITEKTFDAIQREQQ
jgi:hypothetical protein